MSDDYYLRHRGRVRGPFSLDQIRRLHADGRLPGDVEIAEGPGGIYYPAQSLGYLLDPVPPASPGRRPRPQAPPRAAPHRKSAFQPPDPEAEEADEAAPRRDLPTGSAPASPAVLSVLALLALGAAVAISDWVALSQKTTIFTGREPAALELHLGLRTVRLTCEQPGPRLTAAEKSRIARIDGKDVQYADLAELLQAEAGRSYLSRLEKMRWDQTQILLLVPTVIVAVGGLLVAIAGFGSHPGLLARVLALGAGILGIIGFVSFRSMGLLGELVERGAKGMPEVRTGTSFFLGVASGALLLVAGIIFSTARGPSRRRGGHHRVFES